MPAFDVLQRASFAGFPFPVSEVKVTGGIRDHVHEYPHSPGGAVEKLGRKLYEVTMTVPFHNTYKAWPKLWPETLASLRIIFEGQGTFDLVIPTIGTIPAYCVGWSEQARSNKRSGVDAEMTFREDQSNLFLVETLINAKAADVSSVTAEVIALAEDAELEMDLFDGIQDLTNDITSVVDQVELYNDNLDAKLQGLEANVRTLLNTAEELWKPPNHPIADRLRALAVSCIELHEDILRQSAPIVTYVTPRLMSIVEVSIAIYGDTSRASEVMRLNPIEDPFAIPMGDLLRVYAPAEQQRV